MHIIVGLWALILSSSVVGRPYDDAFYASLPGEEIDFTDGSFIQPEIQYSPLEIADNPVCYTDVVCFLPHLSLLLLSQFRRLKPDHTLGV